MSSVGINQSKGFDAMKVTDVKAFVVDCFRTNWVFVKVYTDEGIDGVG